MQNSIALYLKKRRGGDRLQSSTNLYKWMNGEQMQHTPGVAGVVGYTETQRIKHSSHLRDTLLLQTLGQFL